MAVTETNRLRYRATLLSREFKWLFGAVPERFRSRLTSWFWRMMFLAADGTPHLVGEHALADLRDFCRPPGQSLFSSDPLVMARRIGRSEAFDRIVNYLNLDERVVQQLMELDDGLG